MIKLLQNKCKNAILTIEIDNDLILYLLINEKNCTKCINIGNIFVFKYYKLKYEIEYNVDEYYSIFNWTDGNDFIYINNYLNNLKFNKDIMRKIKLLKLYEK